MTNNTCTMHTHTNTHTPTHTHTATHTYTHTHTHTHTKLHYRMINRINIPRSIDGISCLKWVDSLQFSSYSDVIWFSHNTDVQEIEGMSRRLYMKVYIPSRLLLPYPHFCYVLPFVPLIVWTFLLCIPASQSLQLLLLTTHTWLRGSRMSLKWSNLFPILHEGLWLKWILNCFSILATRSDTFLILGAATYFHEGVPLLILLTFARLRIFILQYRCIFLGIYFVVKPLEHD